MESPSFCQRACPGLETDHVGSFRLIEAEEHLRPRKLNPWLGTHTTGGLELGLEASGNPGAGGSGRHGRDQRDAAVL